MRPKYELILTYDDGYMKKEQSYLPELMSALAIYMEDVKWCFASITNLSTGEVIARWTNYGTYGITCEN